MLQASCGECVSEMVIDNQFFVCHPESPSHVTYQARLEGTSERESGSLISLIEEWVRRGGASVIVTGVLMTVDPDCSVAISSISEGECVENVSNSPENVTSSSEAKDSQLIMYLIIGAAGSFLIITTTACITIIMGFFFLKKRQGKGKNFLQKFCKEY